MATKTAYRATLQIKEKKEVQNSSKKSWISKNNFRMFLRKKKKVSYVENF